MYTILHGEALSTTSSIRIKYSHRLLELRAIIHKCPRPLVLAVLVPAFRRTPLHAPTPHAPLRILRWPQRVMGALVGGHPGDIINPEGYSRFLDSSPVGRHIVLGRFGS